MSADWFGERLRELREKSGLTQVELAQRANLTRAGIAQLETGRREPAWRTVVTLCAALGVKSDEFLEKPAERPPVAAGRPRKTDTAVGKPVASENTEMANVAAGKAKVAKAAKAKATGTKQ